MHKMVPATQVRKACGQISPETETRWRTKGLLPKPHRIGGQNFYRDDELAAVRPELFDEVVA